MELFLITLFLVILQGGRVKAEICTAAQFECSSTGECISKAYLCDGERDCTRGEDEAEELNCPPCIKCETSNPRLCLQEKSICDGVYDCLDGSDEKNCTKDTTGSCLDFVCANRLCVSNYFVCDGEDDCGDWSDESSCDCDFEEVNCGRCIPESWLCDTIPDCPGGADEIECGNGTTFYVPMPTFKFLVKQHYMYMDLKQRRMMTEAIYNLDNPRTLTVPQVFQKAKLKRKVQRKLDRFLRG